jgi:hypothetical protein
MTDLEEKIINQTKEETPLDTTHSTEQPVRTNCKKINEKPRLICFLVFLTICGIAVAVCGAYGIFNRNSDHAQNLIAGKATKLQNSTKNLNETEECVQNSNENSKEMELLPCSSGDTKFKYQNNSDHTSLNVMKRHINKEANLIAAFLEALFSFLIEVTKYSLMLPYYILKFVFTLILEIFKIAENESKRAGSKKILLIRKFQ